MNVKLKYCILASAITVLAFLVMRFIRYDFTNLPAFSSADKTVDFEFSDLYASVADSRPVTHLSKDVCVVGIDGLDRNGIADVIRAVDFLGAKTIGLDLFFLWPDAGGDAIEGVLMELGDKVVLPRDIHGTASYFYGSLPNPRFGTINLVASSAHQVVRRYRPTGSMASVLAESSGPVLEGEATLVPFHSVVIDTLSAGSVIDKDGLPLMEAEALISDRIVLIGTLHDPGDCHLTPVDAEMPGVLIHAIMADSFLSGRTIKEAGKNLMTVIAIIYAWFFALLLLIAKYNWDNAGNLAIRIFQIVGIIIMFRIGCHYYMADQLYIDFSEAFLMTVFASLAFDVTYGIYALVHKKAKLCKKS